MPNIKLITRNLANELIPGIRRASGIYILTSFVMDSGVRLLEPHLREAAERGAEIRMLAGDYLYITQPRALRRLMQIHQAIEVRFWISDGQSFHPKAYLLDYDNGEGILIVGSSNLSTLALRVGYEWNLAMDAQAEPSTFQEALEQFMVLFYDERTAPLNEETIARYEEAYNSQQETYPELVQLAVRMDEEEWVPTDQEPEEEPADTATESATETPAPIVPRFAQPEALEALRATIEEGYDRAMVVMATGLGKTYLAGFFARNFRRVLFVAHREEILQQAERSFRRIMPERTSGFYTGTEKNGDAELVFASIFTLGMKKHRERFAPNAFDLIIVDEFHHAAARSYQALLEHFRPKFLLGLTATPDRADGKDIYALCDGNVAYKITFVEAIVRGWLSPFRYYGIYDDIDYSRITWRGTHYDEDELLAAQTKREQAEKIYANWKKLKQTRTLAFCSSIRHADFLASYFREQGERVVSLHSQTTEMTRAEAIRKLTDGELDVIFTVDLFNEGVDIPAVDTLLFVRPTESLTVFTQQVGRGLRLAPGKTHCTIIDLIGNYRNADVKVRLFDVEEMERNGRQAKGRTVAIQPPPGCVVDLDLRVVDLLKEMARKRQPRKDRLLAAYLDLKRELGRRPTYLELHLQGREDSPQYRQEFGSYAGFLHWAGELDEAEQSVYLAHRRWLEEAEKTPMVKSYKMVLLLGMLERGKSDWYKPITAKEAAPFFHRYLTEKEFRKRIDFSDKETSRLHRYDERKVASLIERMPMTMWSGSSRGLISFRDDVFAPQIKVAPEHESILFAWTKEIALYRLQAYFERKAKP